MQHLEDKKVYLRDRYFQEIGTWPIIDLRDGYFTILSKQSRDEAHPILRREVSRLETVSQFEFFYNAEEAFGGEVNIGPSGNWLEVAWCEATSFAAIVYLGQGIPARVKWYDAESPDEAIDQWCGEYVVRIRAVESENDGE